MAQAGYIHQTLMLYPTVSQVDPGIFDKTRDKKQFFYLPDTVRDWPWPRRINPNYEKVKAESTGWLRKFHAFDERSQTKFEACDFSLLACLAYPWIGETEHVRTGCDLMMVFFLFDEYSDIVDGEQVQQQADAILDGMKNPDKPRPTGDILGEATRQFWKLGLETATPRAAKRFEQVWEDYVRAVVDQAKDRDNHRIRSIHDYLSLRRFTIGARPTYALLELPLDIPDEVWRNDLMEKITVASIDLIILDNDLYSYNVEQARGETHNIIPVVMKEKNTDLEGALQWLTEYHDECKAIFLNNYDRLPSWGEKVDADVKVYVDGLGNWVRANVCWSFESGRYFGNCGIEISKHRVVELLPKEN